MTFKFLIAIIFISSLTLSCADSDERKNSHHRNNKDGVHKKGKAFDRKGKKASHREKKIRTQPVLSNKEAVEDLVEEDLEKGDLLVEQPFDSDEEVMEPAGSEGLPVSDEPGEVKVVAEEGSEEFTAPEEIPEVSLVSDVPDDVAKMMNEEAIIGEEVFSITHVGEEGDVFLLKYLSHEIVLDTPGACVQLMGKQFQEIRIEDGTDLFPVICGTESICEPGNYSLTNDSIPLIWDDYLLEPSEYNNSDCQKLPLSD